MTDQESAGRDAGSSAYPDVPQRLRPSPGVSRRVGTDTGRSAPPDGVGWPGGENAASSPTAHAPAQPATSAATTGVTAPQIRPAMRGPRRAHLAVRRVDPWSVLKMTFVFSLGLLVVGVVAIVVLYGILQGMGVFSSITSFLHDISSSTRSVQHYAPMSTVVGYTLVVGVVNVILLTALSTIGAFIYNLCVDLVGGIEVTLTERD